jgi:hypothetical protein
LARSGACKRRSGTDACPRVVYDDIAIFHEHLHGFHHDLLTSQRLARSQPDARAHLGCGRVADYALGHDCPLLFPEQ